MEIERTHSQDSEFLDLVRKLDQDLAIRDGEDHGFYAQFNSVDVLTHCLKVKVNGQAVACGALKMHDEQTAEVKRMYTLPEFRGRGLAKAVLQGLEEWALEVGYCRLILETGLKQPEAIALYERYGFQRIPNYGQYKGISNSQCFEFRLSR
jgi:GNAT superfamily N-acetyltransferase